MQSVVFLTDAAISFTDLLGQVKRLFFHAFVMLSMGSQLTRFGLATCLLQHAFICLFLPFLVPVMSSAKLKARKLQDRLAKLDRDEQRADGKSIRDTDISVWVNSPVSWG
jgi:hypothetical protein